MDTGDVKKIRLLLEDFDLISISHPHCALIPRITDYNELYENISTAIVASKLGLKGLDGAKKRYDISGATAPQRTEYYEHYILCYHQSQHLMRSTVARFTAENRKTPSAGEIGSELALTRLKASFFSAHLLFQLGYAYEGFAVARVVLEQIAWAYEAFQAKKLEDIKEIKAQKSISVLKKLIPTCGPFYGFLSNKTHISYENHLEILNFDDGAPAVIMSMSNYALYGEALLELADMFSIVYEYTQQGYLDELFTLQKTDAQYAIRKDRPFVAIKENLVQTLSNLQNKQEPKPKYSDW